MWFVILTGLLIMQLPQMLADIDFSKYFPTNNEFQSMNLYGVKMYDSHGSRNFYERRYYHGTYNAPDSPLVTIVIGVIHTSETGLDASSYSSSGYQCSVSERAYECTLVEKNYAAQWNSKEYQYSSHYQAEKIIGGERCANNASNFCSSNSSMFVVKIQINSAYNTTNVIPSLGRAVMNLVSSKVSGSYRGSAPQIEILSPKDGEVIYFEPEKDVVFTIKVKVTDDDLTYAGAHYESGNPKPTMVGGELEPKLGSKGGTGSRVVILKPDEVAEGKATIKAYARDSTGNNVEKSITIYLKEKKPAQSSPTTSSTTRTESMSQSTSSSSASTSTGILNKLKSLTGKKQTAGDASGFKEPPEKIKVNGKSLSSEAKTRMAKTQETIKDIGRKAGLEVIEVKTPYGKDVKVLQKDENIKAEKGSSLWFKLKYYGNKYGLDKVVDSAADSLDGVVSKYFPSPFGLFKDYVKAYKDSGLFQGEDAVKKTAKDLHVDKRSAEIYNDMSGIEKRELAISPYKNTLPSTPVTKPIEFTINMLGTGFKKCLAQDYEWEFKKTAERAIMFKKAGMKYRDIIQRTIADVEEETSQSHKVQTMNAQSKGDFRDQETRIRYYLNKLYEEGKI